MDEAHVGTTDEDLALKVQKGDGELFGVLMRRYEKKLMRYGKRFLSDQDNIDDVVQDVFIKTYQSIKSFDISQKFSPWIYRIAHNTFINEIRKNSRGPIPVFDFDTIISHPVYEDPALKEREQKEMRVLLDKGLDKITPTYREVLILFYLEELSYKEIADILHTPVGTVGIRLKRAKEALKKVYKEKELGLQHEQHQ